MAGVSPPAASRQQSDPTTGHSTYDDADTLESRFSLTTVTDGTNEVSSSGVPTATEAALKARTDRLRRLRAAAGDNDVREILAAQLQEAKAALTSTCPLQERLRDAPTRVQTEQDRVQRNQAAVARAQVCLEQPNEKLAFASEALAVMRNVLRES